MPTIEWGQEKHLEACYRIELACNKKALEHDEFRADWFMSSTSVLVALSGNNVLGYVQHLCCYTIGDLCLLRFGVLPSQRRRGIGEVLLRRSVAEAIQHFFYRIRVDVDEYDVPAQQLLKKIGFRCRWTSPKTSALGNDELHFVMNTKPHARWNKDRQDEIPAAPQSK